MLKLPPQDIETERAVLGSLMIDANAIIGVTDFLLTADFYKPAHQKIYEVILDLFNKNQPIDVLSVSTKLKEKNWLEEMVKPFSDPKVVAVQGAYKTKQKSEIANFIQLEIEERYVRMKRANHLDWIGSYSAAYKKDIYLKEGGFDSKFEIASGEDSDLSYRLSEKGLKLMFNPKAIVYHAHAESLENYLKKKFGHAYWRVTLYSKHRQKMMKDSYTPQELKLQLIAISIFIVSLILSPFNLMFAHLALTAFIISIVLMLKTAKFMFDRNPTIGFISVPILFLRDLSLIFGFGFGLLNKKSK